MCELWVLKMSERGQFATFVRVSQNLSGQTAESHENHSQDQRSQGQESNPGQSRIRVGRSEIQCYVYVHVSRGF